jgi:hypothetical protein
MLRSPLWREQCNCQDEANHAEDTRNACPAPLGGESSTILVNGYKFFLCYSFFAEHFVVLSMNGTAILRRLKDGPHQNAVQAGATNLHKGAIYFQLARCFQCYSCACIVTSVSFVKLQPRPKICPWPSFSKVGAFYCRQTTSCYLPNRERC